MTRFPKKRTPVFKNRHPMGFLVERNQGRLRILQKWREKTKGQIKMNKTYLKKCKKLIRIDHPDQTVLSQSLVQFRQKDASHC